LIDINLIVDMFALFGLGALGWAWRLHMQVTEIQAIQKMKVDRICKIENTVYTIKEDLDVIKGMLKVYFDENQR